VNRIFLIGDIILVFVVTRIILAKSRTILVSLGKQELKVAARIMGLMLLSIAVQFIMKGISDAFHLFYIP
jgi:small neutral amino acid transporter SnatA (MarC family)